MNHKRLTRLNNSYLEKPIWPIKYNLLKQLLPFSLPGYGNYFINKS